jgi:hypothetical protein
VSGADSGWGPANRGKEQVTDGASYSADGLN